ncbi:MAG: NERD domain-containing protein [Candidatus Hermodarchaeota archaeon]
MPDPRTFGIKATIVKETDKALLLYLPGGEQEWFPKATIKSDYISNLSEVQDFKVVRWILEKKGIIRRAKNPNVIGQTGSEKYLIDSLLRKGLDGFNSFKDIKKFKNKFSEIIKSIPEMERNTLKYFIERLKSEENDIQVKLDEKKSALKQSLLKEKAELMDKALDSKAEKKIKEIDKTIEKKLDNPFKEEIKQIKKLEKERISREKNLEKSVKKKISQLYKAHNIIQKNQQYFERARGEVAVVKELKRLPETYYILNEVKLSFYRSIKWKKYGEYVKACKIDHVVVGPTGIFLIESKNWNQESLQSANVPIHKEIQRAEYLFFIHMKNQFERKFPTYQIVTTLKPLPQIPFDYIKQLTFEELVDYILGRDAFIDTSDIETIVEWLKSSPYIFNATHVYLKMKY